MKYHEKLFQEACNDIKTHPSQTFAKKPQNSILVILGEAQLTNIRLVCGLALIGSKQVTLLSNSLTYLTTGAAFRPGEKRTLSARGTKAEKRALRERGTFTT